jgi:hypothetical protein
MSELGTNQEKQEASARRRRAADRTPDRLIFLTETGKRLCCSVASVGREHERHWMIIDSDGALYIGPTALPARSPGAAVDLIASWWQEQSSPGIPPRAD